MNTSDKKHIRTLSVLTLLIAGYGVQASATDVASASDQRSSTLHSQTTVSSGGVLTLPSRNGANVPVTAADLFNVNHDHSDQGQNHNHHDHEITSPAAAMVLSNGNQTFDV